MFPTRIFRCLCIVAISFCLHNTSAEAKKITTHPTEVSALLAVKRNLIDHKKHLGDWNKKGDPCISNWTGVLCNDTVGGDGHFHVHEIHLLNKNLSGVLAPELGRLSYLHTLDFMWNNLTGSIPKEIGSISSLVLLLLNGNKLSGFLPEELGNLMMLKRLQIDENNISGPIPKSFAYLSSIRHLHMNNNSISGQIPLELSNMSTVIHLLIDNNNLSGYLPAELSILPELRILQLDNNNFDTSEIPDTYANLSSLAKLSLRNCSLHGAVPDFSRIQGLYYLDFSDNHLSGAIPLNKLAVNMTTIILSNNNLNGSIPGYFSELSFLQTLSLENNSLTGSVPDNIWKNTTFTTYARLTIDLRNNLLTNITGELNPPENVTLRLGGNPICSNTNVKNTGKFCGLNAGDIDGTVTNTTNQTSCLLQSCPIGNFYEYAPDYQIPCFCAAPIRIGYRLKSPSFSYFPPYIHRFKVYVTESLQLEFYQLSIDTQSWEEGPRLGMYLKLFPVYKDNSSTSTFNTSEVRRIRNIFTLWEFPGNDFYGPYELLNFTLLGPYSDISFDSAKSSISKGVLAAIVLGAFASGIATWALITVLITRRRARKQMLISRKRLSSHVSMNIEGVKYFGFKEMALASNNFDSSTIIGQGGYGKVYKGVLADNTAVAIKRAERGSLQGEREFLTEIKLLSRLHHRNLVSLLGYCDEQEEQMLIYEFMHNGSLRDWLSAKGERNLNFDMRLRIALGSAKGILYLHTEANPPVFHRDIKTSNILLDSKLNAKVADFGLSKLAPVLDDEGNTPHHVSTIVKGTPGYLDPEYLLTHEFTDKSDVYSLGVVFLELLTGMHPISRGKNIVREVTATYKSGMIFSIIDSKMGSYTAECVEKFVGLALDSCNDKPDKRPSMVSIVRELENILKAMPELDLTCSTSDQSSSACSGMSATFSSASASSYAMSRDPYNSFSVSGSDLVSGVVPTIIPR
ncbi:hypothetical protein ACFE04_003340 [Oxalis oulophora]